MTTQKAIRNFLNCKTLAVIGVSSTGKGFGVSVFHHLSSAGYKVYAVNKKGGVIGEDILYNSVQTIPAKIEGVVLVIPPSETEFVVKEIIDTGIKNIWMQQGSESKTAIELCSLSNINLVYKECILMYAEPVKSIHAFHRWINKIIKKYPV